MNIQIISSCLGLIVCAFIPACSSLPTYSPKAAGFVPAPGSPDGKALLISEIVKRHAITFGPNGEASDTQSGQPITRAELNLRIDEVVCSLRRSKASRVVLFAHGGLNGLKAHVERSLEGAIRMDPAEYEKALAQRIISSDSPHESESSPDSAFPIFINWKSGFGSTYSSHLTSVRAGISYDHSSTMPKYARWLSAPYGLVRDLGIGILNTPGQFTAEFAKDHETDGGILYSFAPDWFPTRQAMDRRLGELGRSGGMTQPFLRSAGDPIAPGTSYMAGCPYNISLAEDSTLGWQTARDTALFYSSVPLKLPAMPLVSGLGTPAWNSMKRRTSTALYPDSFFVSRAVSTHFPTTEADSALFFTRVLKEIQDRKLPLDCIGHSMGAIVLNRVISAFPDLKINDLVYMAPAATLEDSAFAIRKSSTEKRLKCNIKSFYLLTLHPRREVEESSFPIVPNGSLLNWIDEFYENPLTFGDRTLGTFQNAVIGSHIWLPQGKNVSIKAFGVSTGGKNVEDPQAHGEFGSRPYWKKSFWRHDDGDHSWRQFYKRTMEKSSKLTLR